jgi:hypothetical protein
MLTGSDQDTIAGFMTRLLPSFLPGKGRPVPVGFWVTIERIMIAVSPVPVRLVQYGRASGLRGKVPAKVIATARLQEGTVSNERGLLCIWFRSGRASKGHAIAFENGIMFDPELSRPMPYKEWRLFYGRIHNFRVDYMEALTP